MWEVVRDGGMNTLTKKLRKCSCVEEAVILFEQPTRSVRKTSLMRRNVYLYRVKKVLNHNYAKMVRKVGEASLIEIG